MIWLDFLDGLYFDNELIFNQQIETISFIKLNLFIDNWDRALTIDREPALPQLVRQGDFSFSCNCISPEADPTAPLTLRLRVSA